MMHKPLLVTIESLKTEIQYYVTQLLIYAETTPDAEPATITGLGGMRYGLDGRRQETMRQIRTLYHSLEPVKEDQANDTMTMDIGAITVEEDWSEESESDNQSYGAPDRLFFLDPDHEEIRLYDEPKVHKYWESGLTMESLGALW